MDYQKKYLKYKEKYLSLSKKVNLKNLSQVGGESEALNQIVQFAKDKFNRENGIEESTDKSLIYEKMRNLPEHKIEAHTPIEDNWKAGSSVSDVVTKKEKIEITNIETGEKSQREIDIITAKIYNTNPLKKSATNKNLNEILQELQNGTIQIEFTWSESFQVVFVNFFKNVTSKEDIEYVSNAFEPCTCDGKPDSKAQAYSYYKSTYDKPIMPSPYQILSREFTNQIYEWCNKNSTLEAFRTGILNKVTDESEVPLRFTYNIIESETA
jgi:hypothetical protein